MPLSSTNAAQSIVRPGVCTSATRPASPFDGQVIYETDTDKTLVWNGSGWVFLSTSRANPGGLDFIKSQTIGSAVSSVEVTGAFSSTYDNYKITVAGGAGTTNINLTLRLGSTTTGYYNGIIGVVWSNGATNAGASNNTLAYMNYVGAATTTGINMNYDVFSPFLSVETYGSGQFIAYNASYYTASKLSNTTSYTSFTLATDTGTLTGGTIRVYGYVNS